MKKTFLLSLTLFCYGAAAAQEDKQEKVIPVTQTGIADVSAIAPGTAKEVAAPPDQIYTYVEQLPSFPGGTEKLHAFIEKHKRYPKDAVAKGIEGKVYLAFTVKKDGRIENIEVKRGLSASLDAEAVRLIKAMPPWIPARQNGKEVNCMFTIPVSFYFLK
ncbi:MAG: hypothetical protein BGO31_19470 [Bacteroidetes bacterium 43-16]|nr:MAG: hypothetical protein BGO31_19470 [Bacteroidetes bacterium 43-16]